MKPRVLDSEPGSPCSRLWALKRCQPTPGAVPGKSQQNSGEGDLGDRLGHACGGATSHTSSFLGPSSLCPDGGTLGSTSHTCNGIHLELWGIDEWSHMKANSYQCLVAFVRAKRVPFKAVWGGRTCGYSSEDRLPATRSSITSCSMGVNLDSSHVCSSSPGGRPCKPRGVVD
jgi:hypothetical protein